MKILAAILLTLTFFSGNAKGTDHTTFTFDQDVSTQKELFSKPNLKKLVSDIASYGRVEFGPVGYQATTTKQYDRYLKLLSIATDSQLVVLTDHPSATVKVYAASILCVRKYEKFDKIYNKLINNRQFFSLASGCIVESMRIDIWINEKVNGPVNLFK